jgi:transcriptional regulator with XRE-family HTH domain
MPADHAPEPSTAAEPNYVDMHVGACLRMRRKMLGLSQDLLAKQMGVSFQQLQKYERGTNRVSASKLYTAAKALRVPVSFFFAGIPNPESDADGRPAAHLAALVSTLEGIELVQLFPTIPNADKRRLVLELVHALAEAEPGQDA